jgi:nitroimidazol reductase NimA-like FMN-containing flavoprotein (pyridoxamine 5'-phosphate oxidase superfamily)
MPRTKNITLRSEMDAVIHRCEVCYLGMTDDEGHPYVLPFNFAYEGNTVYLHSAQEGTKMNILRKHPAVCIAFSTDHAMRHTSDNVACSYGMKYRSVLVHGEVVFIPDFEEKQRVLSLVMKKYTGRDDFSYSAPSVNEVCVYKVDILKITGRESGY